MLQCLQLVCVHGTLSWHAPHGLMEKSLWQVELPQKEIVIARRDDAAMYDDVSQLQQEFRDDPR